jgi:hypothetical protein
MNGFYVHGKPPYEQFKLHVKPKGKQVELTITGARKTPIVTVLAPHAMKYYEIQYALRKKST